MYHMFNATNVRGTKKYRVMHHNHELSYSSISEGKCYTKTLTIDEEKLFDDYVFTVVEDAECTCTHELLCEADCMCDRPGFSVYVCSKNSAGVLRGFECATYELNSAQVIKKMVAEKIDKN